ALWLMVLFPCLFSLNAAPATEIYTLSLHDALPIWVRVAGPCPRPEPEGVRRRRTCRPARRVVVVGQGRSRRPGRDHDRAGMQGRDRKSTRLNSSHRTISYAVFCLKKKKTHQQTLMS